MDDNSKNRDAVSAEPTPDSGVFLVKGDRVTILPFSIFTDENGETKTTPIGLNLEIDMTRYWLSIAFQHLVKTEQHHHRLMTAKLEKNDDKIAKQLVRELSSGMQSIMASSIAIDAYYASIKDIIELPNELTATWRTKGTARHAQIAETIKRGFQLKPAGTKNLKNMLEQIFSFRDKAVHPKSGTAQPLLHRELNKFTDWRYATYRFSNAKAILAATLSILLQTAGSPSQKTSNQIKEYSINLSATLKPIFKKWEHRFGDIPT